MDEASIIMRPMDVRTFIDQWPKRADLAADINAILALERGARAISIQTDAVHKWAQNQSIPAKYHYTVLRAAERRGVQVDALQLAKMHAAA